MPGNRVRTGIAQAPRVKLRTPMDSPEEIALALIAGVSEQEGPLGKTKLVKLLYLVDVDQYARYRTRPTRIPWKYYLYGPYDHSIEDLLRRIDIDVSQDDVTTQAGRRATIFRVNNSDAIYAGIRLSPGVERAVNRVLRAWAVEELNKMLDYVYFRTEPIMSAKPGDPLNFDTIPRYVPPRVPAIGIMSASRQEALSLAIAGAVERDRQARENARSHEQDLFVSEDVEYESLLDTFRAHEHPESHVEAVAQTTAWPEAG